MRLANYTERDLQHLCVFETQTVLEAMQIMSKAGLRLVPVVVEEGRRFVGVVADGDLRRFLANGGQTSALIADVVNRKPSIIEAPMPLPEVRSLMMQRGLEYLPLIQDGYLVSMFVLWVAASPEKLSAVIMAGGLGSRLAPLTDNCPKPLLPIGGKPILTHIIEHLRDQGVNHFVLSLNYLGDMIVNHYGDGAELGVSITYVRETMRMGTGGALGLIDPSELSEPFLCLNGDILNDIDVDALKLQHMDNHWDATMIVRNYSYQVPYGVVNVGQQEDFVGAEEKPTMNFRINAGFYMLSKSILTVIPREVFYDLPTLFSDLQTRGMKCGTKVHHGRWIDIGNVTELERARAIFEGSEE
ncbi:nucleotidyltransferase family protein [Loktanella sp. F6476L]|uniref:sugar phosphate nucleotidyltransferase n=1 Tax=Loktanella sp. F6476L TaxID=2926405 RepID=UPI001FF2396D|nr:nucleotidyltransferase family protein [Loktanella sp. F6476L]